ALGLVVAENARLRDKMYAVQLDEEVSRKTRFDLTWVETITPVIANQEQKPILQARRQHVLLELSVPLLLLLPPEQAHQQWILPPTKGNPLREEDLAGALRRALHHARGASDPGLRIERWLIGPRLPLLLRNLDRKGRRLPDAVQLQLLHRSFFGGTKSGANGLCTLLEELTQVRVPGLPEAIIRMPAFNVVDISRPVFAPA